MLVLVLTFLRFCLSSSCLRTLPCWWPVEAGGDWVEEERSEPSKETDMAEGCGLWLAGKSDSSNDWFIERFSKRVPISAANQALQSARERLTYHYRRLKQSARQCVSKSCYPESPRQTTATRGLSRRWWPLDPTDFPSAPPVVLEEVL